jgi:hypothetical protein
MNLSKLLIGSIAAATISHASPGSAESNESMDRVLTQCDAAVVFAPASQRSLWKGGRIVTETEGKIVDVAFGSLQRGDVVTIETKGGVVDGIGQWVAGHAAPSTASPSLVFVRRREDAALFPPSGSAGIVPLSPVDTGRLKPLLLRIGERRTMVLR